MAVAARLVPAFRSDFSREAELGPQTPLDRSRHLRAGDAVAGNPRFHASSVEGERAGALEPRPDTDGLSGSVLRGGGGGFMVQLPTRQHADLAATTEVGDARH